MSSAKKICYILDYIHMPKEMQRIVRDRYMERFGNDCYLPYCGELKATELVSMDAIENYWKDQSENNGFKGNLGEFIQKYYLEFEVWIVSLKLDLGDVDQILIKISW